jgi:hypothetical protein
LLFSEDSNGTYAKATELKRACPIAPEQLPPQKAETKSKQSAARARMNLEKRSKSDKGLPASSALTVYKHSAYTSFFAVHPRLDRGRQVVDALII